MTELLKRWAELEPKRCRFDRKDYEWCVLTSTGWGCMDEGYLDKGWIQYAVQQAIEARGWEYTSGYRVGRNQMQYHGFVDTLIGANRHTVYSTNSPAHALLSAYLQALNGEVK
jgi:hypothetical protein